MTVLRVLDTPPWTLDNLKAHLQGLVDLELWTIPYYMAPMYSIRDPSSASFQLIQAVIRQEMLHVQLAGNIANAFGLQPAFRAPVYQGQQVPHIDFALDTPNPTQIFTPFSAEIGPCDEQRLNTMCLIEYPAWDTRRQPAARDDTRQYGSIGEFYAAVRVGMVQMSQHVRGNQHQIDQFGSFYNGVRQLTITEDGRPGLLQALELIEVIVSQGEGQTEAVDSVPAEFWNTGTGYEDSWPHFQKFKFIRDQRLLPTIYQGETHPQPGSPGERAQQILMRDFGQFLQTLTGMFSDGRVPADFGVQMAKLGGDMLACWQCGAVPRFS